MSIAAGIPARVLRRIDDTPPASKEASPAVALDGHSAGLTDGVFAGT
jgi:hypothetical protein